MGATADNKVSRWQSNELIFVCTAQQVVSIEAEHAIKRTTSSQLESQAKKTMTDRPASQEQGQCVGSKSTDVSTFTSAAKLLDKAPNLHLMSEIPDEEFLELAIKFEKENP